MKILFVCQNNICRSPMAENIFKFIAQVDGKIDDFEIASAACRDTVEGSDMLSLVRIHLFKYVTGKLCPPHKARKITKEDYEHYDLIIGMDSPNIRDMLEFFGGDPKNKIHKLLEFCDSSSVNGNEARNVSEPQFTGNYAFAAHEIGEGCAALYKKMVNPHFHF